MSCEVKNILVTGADGFIGCHLVQRLRADGYNVYPSAVNDGDISNDKLKFNQIDHVFHLAARTFVPGSWDEPYEYYRTNVMGTVNVLNFCHENNCSITIPSTYMYGNPQYLPIDEKHSVDMNVSPYHHSKFLSESIVEFYAKRFGLSCTILRLFNVFGFGQNKNFLIPHLIEEVCGQKNQIVVKDLCPKRDYIFIDDVIEAFVKSMSNVKSDFHVYNVGKGNSWSVAEVATCIMKVFNSEKELVSLNERRNGEIMDTVADITKIEEELNWHPLYDLEAGLIKIREQMKRDSF